MSPEIVLIRHFSARKNMATTTTLLCGGKAGYITIETPDSRANGE
jgi:hypothetical protein